MRAFILLNYVFQLMIQYIPYLNWRLDETATYVIFLLLTLEHIYIKYFVKIQITLQLPEKLEVQTKCLAELKSVCEPVNHKKVHTGWPFFCRYTPGNGFLIVGAHIVHAQN